MIQLKTTTCFLVGCALITGCISSPPPMTPAPASTPAPPTAGAVGEFYHPVVLNPDTTRTVDPKCIYAGSQEEARNFYSKYIADGYHLVGYSSFKYLPVPSFIPPPDEHNMIAQAKKISADIVLYYTSPGESETIQSVEQGVAVSNSVTRVEYYIQFLAAP